MITAPKRVAVIPPTELTMRRRNGTAFPGEQGLTLLRDGLGHVKGWICAIRDMTERKAAEAELRMLSRSTIEVQEAERRRIAAELHDGVNQTLASVKMRLRKAKDLVANASPAGREILTRCERLLVEAIEENRDISHNLHPRGLSDLGLKAACRNLCKELRRRTELVVDFRILLPEERLPAAIELNLFRILQEAINNLEKHARATKVWVRISIQRGVIELKIRDNGRGFSEKAKGKSNEQGIGLANIRQRAMSIGATIEIESSPKGTSIVARVSQEAAK
jgi:two-component system NarL family sensor kinase